MRLHHTIRFWVFLKAITSLDPSHLIRKENILGFVGQM